MAGPQNFEDNLGTWRGRTYLMAVRGTPDYFDPDDFSVNVYYKNAATERSIDIARVDTSHGYTHMDRLFRDPKDKKPVDWDIWEAIDHFEEYWPRYAKQFEKNWG
ncbi:DUF7718 family protein [Haladaptatus sp. NG-SE-30]